MDLNSRQTLQIWQSLIGLGVLMALTGCGKTGVSQGGTNTSSSPVSLAVEASSVSLNRATTVSTTQGSVQGANSGTLRWALSINDSRVVIENLAYAAGETSTSETQVTITEGTTNFTVDIDVSLTCLDVHCEHLALLAVATSTQVDLRSQRVLVRERQLGQLLEVADVNSPLRRTVRRELVYQQATRRDSEEALFDSVDELADYFDDRHVDEQE